MRPPEPAAPPDIEQKSFMLLLLVLTIGFAVVVQPHRSTAGCSARRSSGASGRRWARSSSCC